MAMKKTQRMLWNQHYRLHESGWRKFTEFDESNSKYFSGKNVLELGCGNGKTIEGLLRSKPKKIVAIDFSEIAVRIAEKKFSKQISSRKIQILHNDATELSFKKDSFDAVVCFHTLGAMLFSQRKKCVGEIFRVLKKSGRVFFEDFAVGDLREKSTELKLVEKNTLQKKNGIIQHFFIEEEVEGLFSRFKIIEIKSTGECLQLGKERVLRSEVKGVFEKP